MLERKEEEKRQRFEREKQLSLSDSELAFAVDIDAICSWSSNSSSIFSEELSNLLQEDRNVKPIPTIALKANRFDVSNRAAVAISTAALIDFRVVSAENGTHIIDSNEVWRARQKLRKNVRKNDVFLQNDVSAIFFDSRKDLNVVQRVDDRWYSNARKENQYVLVGEPEIVHLDHVTLERGSCRNCRSTLPICLLLLSSLPAFP